VLGEIRGEAEKTGGKEFKPRSKAIKARFSTAIHSKKWTMRAARLESRIYPVYPPV
jgi:hypothetical protein